MLGALLGRGTTRKNGVLPNAPLSLVRRTNDSCINNYNDSLDVARDSRWKCGMLSEVVRWRDERGEWYEYYKQRKNGQPGGTDRVWTTHSRNPKEFMTDRNIGYRLEYLEMSQRGYQWGHGRSWEWAKYFELNPRSTSFSWGMQGVPEFVEEHERGREERRKVRSQWTAASLTKAILYSFSPSPGLSPTLNSFILICISWTPTL